MDNAAGMDGAGGMDNTAGVGGAQCDAGVCPDAGDAAGGSGDDCGCRVVGGRGSSPLGMWVAAVFGVALGQRLRRRGRRTSKEAGRC